MRSRPGRVRRLWRAVKRRLPGLGRSEPPPEWPPGPSEQDALVPVGPPRRPKPSSAAVVELPTEPDPLVYPIETDAVGRELPEDEEDSDYGASAAL